MNQIKKFVDTNILPGIAVMLVIAGISYLVNQQIHLVSSMLVAILLGVAMRNLGIIHPTLEPGLRFSAKTILRVGVVLLGLKLSIPQILALGFGPIIVIIATVSATFCATIALGKLLRIAHTTTILTATGTSICGAAAVAGMTSVVKRRGDKDEDIDSAAATAIASVTLFGTLGLAIFPLIAHSIGLTMEQTGVWLGAAIHEVGQVVASAGIAGENLSHVQAEQLMNIATVTKLGRVATLAVLVTLMGILEQRNLAKYSDKQIIRGQVQNAVSGMPVEHNDSKSRPPILPLFVAGFLCMVLFRSVLEWGTGKPVGNIKLIIEYIDMLATFLLTIAMGAMGAGVNLKTIMKSGLKSLSLGLMAATLAALVALLATLISVH